MLNKWKCKSCGKINTKYTIFCEHCSKERKYLDWLLNWDNSALWFMVSAVLISILVVKIFLK